MSLWNSAAAEVPWGTAHRDDFASGHCLRQGPAAQSRVAGGLGWEDGGHPTPTPHLRDQTYFVVFDLFSSAPVSTFLSVSELGHLTSVDHLLQWELGGINGKQKH